MFVFCVFISFDVNSYFAIVDFAGNVVWRMCGECEENFRKSGEWFMFSGSYVNFVTLLINMVEIV